jgi:serine phosphatase RsbU (regulator of sigma subunit)/anti-sigma regulatory factor (Ser/Thr protein kinase)
VESDPPTGSVPVRPVPPGTGTHRAPEPGARPRPEPLPGITPGPGARRPGITPGPGAPWTPAEPFAEQPQQPDPRTGVPAARPARTAPAVPAYAPDPTDAELAALVTDAEDSTLVHAAAAAVAGTARARRRGRHAALASSAPATGGARDTAEPGAAATAATATATPAPEDGGGHGRPGALPGQGGGQPDPRGGHSTPAAPGPEAEEARPRHRTPDSALSSTPPRGTDSSGAAGPAAAPGHPGKGDEESSGARALRAVPGAERLRYVGAATRRIARGLDLDEILLGLCRSVVPAFADSILVYLRDPLPVGDERPTGPLVLKLRRSDRVQDEAAEQPAAALESVLQPVLPSTEGTYGAAVGSLDVPLDGALAEVLRGVRPVFAEGATARAALEELLTDAPGDGGDAPAGATVRPGGRRAILAPLRGRRRVIGAAVLLRRAERDAFEGDDLLVAAQLATHTALGVDKAVLYDREAYIADSLQREMLPDSLPQPTGVRLASRYLPAAESARVGGDWYDAIPLPGSRVALVVGDVMGHSMTSAAIMGQLRTTVQTLAGLDLAPQEVLYHLDEQAQRLGSDRMATCVYAVYDPIAHRMTIANAGHPPPVLLHANGVAEVLRVPPGAPIGVGGVPFEAVELPAPAGATLLLYTDGLVESRTRDVWGGIEMLRERLHEASMDSAPPPLDPLCDEVLEIVGPGDRDDDIALLAARFDGIAPRDVAYWFLEPRPQTAGRARRLIRQALARWDLESLSEATELLVSEVVTNAVRFAERPITLRLLRTDVLRCEVGDDAPTLPRMRHAQPQDEGGRGLYLVNRMAQRWGATRLSSGKVVWFEMNIPGGLHR